MTHDARSIAISLDGNVFSRSNRDHARVWNLNTGRDITPRSIRVLTTTDLTIVQDFALSNNGS